MKKFQVPCVFEARANNYEDAVRQVEQYIQHGRQFVYRRFVDNEVCRVSVDVECEHDNEGQRVVYLDNEAGLEDE